MLTLFCIVANFISTTNLSAVLFLTTFFFVQDEMEAHNVDVFCLTETCRLRPGDVFPELGLSNSCYNYLSWPRVIYKCGGGLAIIHKGVRSMF